MRMDTVEIFLSDQVLGKLKELKFHHLSIRNKYILVTILTATGTLIVLRRGVPLQSFNLLLCWEHHLPNDVVNGPQVSLWLLLLLRQLLQLRLPQGGVRW